MFFSESLFMLRIIFLLFFIMGRGVIIGLVKLDKVKAATVQSYWEFK